MFAVVATTVSVTARIDRSGDFRDLKKMTLELLSNCNVAVRTADSRRQISVVQFGSVQTATLATFHEIANREHHVY